MPEMVLPSKRGVRWRDGWSDSVECGQGGISVSRLLVVIRFRGHIFYNDSNIMDSA